MSDRILIHDLLARGIVGVNEDERRERQDVLVNVVMWVDTRTAAASDDIAAAVNYRSVAKRILAQVESGAPLLVERLASELARMILSEFAGAARELSEALIVNPYDTEQFADAIRYAVQMDSSERTLRMNRMRRRVEEYNVYRWAARFLTALSHTRVSPDSMNSKHAAEPVAAK